MLAKLQGWFLDAILLIVVPLGLIAGGTGLVEAIADTIRDL